MKKRFKATVIFTALMVVMALSAKAQQVSGGIKSGLTMSNLYIEKDDIDDENSRFGFHAGLFSQIMILEKIGIQPELLFTTKGTEATYGGIFDQTVNFNLNYLEVPVFVLVRPIGILEFHAGPYVGLLVNSTVEYSGTIDDVDEIDRDNFSTLDYGIGVGMALNFDYLQTGIRYNMGLQKLAESEIADLLLGDSKNGFGQLYVSLKLNK